MGPGYRRVEHRASAGGKPRLPLDHHVLPDGRLLHAGGGDGANLPRELNAELFTPPYLCAGRAR